MKKTLYLFAFSLFLLATLFIPYGKVLAASTTPTSVVIEDAFGFQHILEDGDQLYLIEYTIEWAAPGDAPGYVGDEYLAEFLDDSEIFASTQPWGYISASADTISWWTAVYVTAADVTAKSITYGAAANKVAIAGNPALAWSAGIPYTDTAAITYDTSDNQASTEQALESRFRLMALYYEQLSGNTLDLVEEVGGVLKLTDTGETYFTSTLSTIRDMVPGLFADSITAATFDLDEKINDFNVYSDTTIPVYGATWSAQSFTADFSYAISGAQLKVLRVGNPGNVTLSLRASSGGTPTGADLAAGTVDGNDFSDYTTGEWETIVFDDDYTLTGGNEYTLLLRATTGTLGNRVGWRGHTGNLFTSGTYSSSVDSGATWTVGNYDMTFACISKDAETGAGSMRGAARLEDSPFDLTDLAGEMGLSTLWMSSLVWLGITIAMIYAGIRVTNSNQIVWSIFILMSPLGWYTGFLAPAVAVAVAAVCALGFIYTLFFKPSGV